MTGLSVSSGRSEERFGVAHATRRANGAVERDRGGELVVGTRSVAGCAELLGSPQPRFGLEDGRAEAGIRVRRRGEVPAPHCERRLDPRTPLAGGFEDLAGSPSQVEVVSGPKQVDGHRVVRLMLPEEYEQLLDELAGLGALSLA